MSFRLFPLRPVVLIALLSACSVSTTPPLRDNVIPAPTQDMPRPRAPQTHTAVFAGGCFWGMQWVFEHVRGVQQVEAGYAGGSAATAHYGVVSNGSSGHAEAIRVHYDPTLISYGQLLHVYFAIATDPTQRNRQDADIGTQYRGVIFTSNTQQRKVALTYITQLETAHVFNAPIVTQVQSLPAFYRAEDYHQDYARLHPAALYIVINDAPKIRQLAQQLPALYRTNPVRYSP